MVYNGEKMAAPNQMVSSKALGNTWILQFLLPKKNDTMPPITYTFRHLMYNEKVMKNFCKKARVHKIVHLRDPNDPMKELDGNRNGKLRGASWQALLMVRTDSFDDETLRNWANNVAKTINSLSQLKDKYPMVFGYAGDVTPPTLQPLSYYITIPDILQCLKRVYFPVTDIRQTLNRKDMDLYFDKESLKLARGLVNNGNGGANSWTFNNPEEEMQGWFD